MDKWSDDQLKKMELGGNIKAKDFFEASPDYYQGMSIKEKYSSVFATQYKEKVTLSHPFFPLHRGNSTHTYKVWHVYFFVVACRMHIGRRPNPTSLPLLAPFPLI